MTPLPSTRLMTSLPWSAMLRSPAASKAMPYGNSMRAFVAGPPSPVYPPSSNPLAPDPATVVITPFASISRTRLLSESDTNRFPPLSNASALGQLSRARAAGPPSPAKLPLSKPSGPDPATTATVPFDASRNTRCAGQSEKYTCPSDPMARASGAMMRPAADPEVGVDVAAPAGVAAVPSGDAVPPEQAARRPAATITDAFRKLLRITIRPVGRG